MQEFIGLRIVAAENFLLTIGPIIIYIWWFCLLVFIIKALITKSLLDHKKRNMIAIKCIVVQIWGHAGPIIINRADNFIPHNSYFGWFAFHAFYIVMIISLYGILLFYSGNPLIFWQKEVKYSWPIKPEWNDGWLIKYGNIVIVIFLLIVFYCDAKGYI